MPEAPAAGVVSGETLLERFPEEVGPYPLAASSTSIDGALGYEVSSATARYTADTNRAGPAVVLNVLDVGSPDMATNMGYGWGTGADTAGVETFEGFPARVGRNPQRGIQEVRILVGGRFFVEAQGEGVDRALVEEAARALDLRGLAALAGR